MADTIRNTIGENFGGPAASLATHGFSIEEVPDQTGKVALVTGGSEGIGYAVTHTLLKKNVAKLYILSVSEEVVTGAMEAVRSELGDEAAGKTEWIKCDLTDWEAVAGVAKKVTKGTDRLDILVNNAARGIMTAQLTDYGVDRHMALNHMGHVILTSHLLPLLKKTASAGNTVRIVSQGSNAHQAAPSSTKFASLEEINQDAGANGQYGRAKLANILYARWLNKNLTSTHPKILANATHPGFVATKMSREDIHEPFPLAGYAMSVGLAPFQKSQFEGGLSALYAATTTEKSGEYICPPAVPEAGTSMAQDMELAEQLMKLTKEVVMEKTRTQSVEKGCPFTMA